MTLCDGRVIATAAAVIAFTCGGLTASAQGWPTRPVTLVVPFPAGGATDTLGRLLGKGLGDRLGQPVVVENRGGAGGGVGAASVARAAADGYTLLLATSSTQTVIPVTSKQSYDPLKDFTPIGLVASAPNLLIVSPRVKGTGVPDLVAHVKAAGGKANFASSGPGSITHLVAALFNATAGLEAAHVPYKAGVQAVGDLKSGQISYQFDSIVWSLPLFRAGEIKVFGIASAKRSALAPDIPTVAEQGLPGFQGDTWFALVAPSGLDVAITGRLHKELSASMADGDIVKRMAAIGAEPQVSDGSVLVELTRADQARWKKLADSAGIKTQ